MPEVSTDEKDLDRIEEFRRDRVKLVEIGDLRLFELWGESARIVFHIIPVGSFKYGEYVIPTIGEPNLRGLTPLGENGGIRSYDYDGYVTWIKNPGADTVVSYAQLFSNGRLEFVDCWILRPRNSQRLVPGYSFEEILIKKLAQVLTLFETWSVPAPFLVLLSLVNIKGYRIATERMLEGVTYRPHPINRENLLIPGVELAEPKVDPARALKPIFDSVWNAAGWPRSQNYDENQNWKER